MEELLPLNESEPIYLNSGVKLVHIAASYGFLELQWYPTRAYGFSQVSQTQTVYSPVDLEKDSSKLSKETKSSKLYTHLLTRKLTKN